MEKLTRDITIYIGIPMLTFVVGLSAGIIIGLTIQII